MKYRKKPVVIEAFKMTRDIEFDHDTPKWFQAAFHRGEVFDETAVHTMEKLYFVKTLEGIMKINPGDYVIQGVQGEIYPCKPDIFEATYEEVTE